MKVQLPFIVLIFLGCSSKSNQEFPYSQPDEIVVPIPFNEELVTTNGIAFSKDGRTLYTSIQRKDTFTNGRLLAAIRFSTFNSGSWSQPVNIQPEWSMDAYHPILSEDNNTLFFNSRSHPDSTRLAIPHNIWKAQKTKSDWSAPSLVEGVNSTSYDSYPSLTSDNHLYFNSDRDGGKGGMDIYVSRFKDGSYQEPVNIEEINSADVENDLVVDPEERFIIFNRYVHATQSIDLFISFNAGSKWTTPRELDNINHPEKWELTPSLSPDGEYFFFELDNKIMQVSLSALIYSDELPEIGKRK